MLYDSQLIRKESYKPNKTSRLYIYMTAKNELIFNNYNTIKMWIEESIEGIGAFQLWQPLVFVWYSDNALVSGGKYWCTYCPFPSC